jgi:predicted phage-related endonuclease
MSDEQLLQQLSIAIRGIDEIKKSNEETLASLNEFKAEFKAETANLKLEIGKLDVKVSGIDTRLGNEEVISRNALGIVAGGTMLAVVKYIFFPS